MKNTYEYVIIAISIILILLVGSKAYKIKQFSEAYPVEVVMPYLIYDDITDEYTGTDNEFLFCLQGKLINDSIIISDYYKPEVIDASSDSLSIRGCFDKNNPIGSFYNTIAVVHSHPKGTCFLSRQDLYTFGSMETLASGVVCGENDMRFFTQKNLEVSINTKVI